MKRIAQFYKVSFEQFLSDWVDCFPNTPEVTVKAIYDNIKLPRRATTGSAGYDFFAPINFEIRPNETLKLPTGIRVKIEDGWVLKCYPRSSLGFKYKLQLNNTVGIIDSDYYHSKNEGHIFVKMTNTSNEGKVASVNSNEGYMQGIFVEYGITFDDEVQAIRDGGFGSTNSNT
jgi:dUTP pyrophosphatase